MTQVARVKRDFMKPEKLLKTARKCATEFWLKASARIQDAADRGDTKSVYEEI